ncbi:MAG TPA: hypothetical protein ENI68_05790 [Gammaproteobacteria bacterium]|nr:hypothetical protein [Gammaproteobacteria bacterium]
MVTPKNTGLKLSIGRLAVAILVIVSLSGIAWTWGDVYGRAFFPLYRWSFKTLTPFFKVESVRLETLRGEPIIKIYAQTAGERLLSGRVLPDGISVSSSTLLGHALEHFILLFSVVFLWPVRIWWERWALLLFAVPGLIMIEALDVPLVLAGALEDLVLFNQDPNLISTSFLINGMNFMNGGGRLALSLTVAMLTVFTWRKLVKLPE